eukprot:jgi/Astpho2/1691/fgenesh1_pg.00032_%23_31_t
MCLDPVASLLETPGVQVRMLDEAETTLTSIDQASERLVQNVLKQAQTAKPSYGLSGSGSFVPVSPTRSTGRFTAAEAPPTSAPASPTRLDGKEFFRTARQRLSSEAFSSFLQAIKELNSGKLNRNDTLQRARGHAAPPAPSAGTQAAEGASEDAPLPQSVSVASGVTSEAAARAAKQQRQARNAASAASSSAGAGSHQGSFQDLVRDSRRLQRRLRAPRAVWDNGRRLPRNGANAKAEHGTSGTSLRGSKRSSSASELVEAGSLSISQPDAKRARRDVNPCSGVHPREEHHRPHSRSV